MEVSSFLLSAGGGSVPQAEATTAVVRYLRPSDSAKPKRQKVDFNGPNQRNQHTRIWQGHSQNAQSNEPVCPQWPALPIFFVQSLCDSQPQALGAGGAGRLKPERPKQGESRFFPWQSRIRGGSPQIASHFSSLWSPRARGTGAIPERELLGPPAAAAPALAYKTAPGALAATSSTNKFFTFPRLFLFYLSIQSPCP